MKRSILLSILFIAAISMLFVVSAPAQPGNLSREELIQYTPEWEGERFPDGRPKVPDDIIERMKLVSIEEAWSTCTNAGFTFQYVDDWLSIHPEKVLVGRALTAVWMPGRPDVQKVIEGIGKEDGRIGAMNAWPVDMLQPGDVYVCDHFGLKINGASIGDNVANAIYANSGNGIVYNGTVRDIQGIKELENFTSFVRDYHPSYHFGTSSRVLNSTMVSINGPTRIGRVLVMPGDIVLGREGGVIFIPPHLAERVVKSSEVIRLRDMFGHLRLQEKTYTPGQIDTRWSEEIEKDFSKWMNDHIDELPVPKEQIQEILKQRTW
ncbi:RraA family protein [Candidatus Latescibacterota bacterium]